MANQIKPSNRRFTPPLSWRSRTKIPLLYLGDIIFFYIALALTLFIRYGEVAIKGASFEAHAEPFTIALLAWLLIFYIGGLYERQIFNREVLVRRFFYLVGIGGLFLILLFYFVPSFGIAPKANLFIFIGIFAASGYAWRASFITLLRERAGVKSNRVMLVGDTEASREIHEQVTKLPQIGYEIALWLKDGLYSGSAVAPEEFTHEIIIKGINTIVIPSHVEHDAGALRMLYYAFISGIEVTSSADFYERLFDRVSISELDDSWLIKNLPRVAKRYRALRYASELIFALILVVLFSPIMILSAILIFVTSPGGVLYKQKRVGQNEQIFELYKFRTMHSDKNKNPDADNGNPTWSVAGDSRVTPIGKFLRASHIDEFPQLFNIIAGNMSFVGPRPERPEFTVELEKQIPYYELRYILKPGLTGWAQINYRYGASVDDAYQKLQYEIYYLKNRSLVTDLSIIIKTIKKFFVNG